MSDEKSRALGAGMIGGLLSTAGFFMTIVLCVWFFAVPGTTPARRESCGNVCKFQPGDQIVHKTHPDIWYGIVLWTNESSHTMAIRWFWVEKNAWGFGNQVSENAQPAEWQHKDD
jgi:hypothetical protein